MNDLNGTTLASLPDTVKKPEYDRKNVTAGIAHFSLGNFHRAHQAVYLDRCLHLAGQEGWGILGIGLMDDVRERAKADILPKQDYLYTLTEFPPENAPIVRVIGSIVDYLHAPADPAAVLSRLCDPAIRIVSMTITEGGYNIDDRTGKFRLDTPAIMHDLANPNTPTTIFSFVAEALRRRRAEGIVPFTVLSCDNLRHNGDVARTAFLSFAQARDPELATWMEAAVPFPNCMVDRITPATSEQDADRLNKLSNIGDELPVFSEDFIQWVVEDKFVSGRPDLQAAGVQMTTDVHRYEQVKLRLLNASHSMLCYAGLLCGYRLAHETMADPLFYELLKQFMEQDAIPLLQAPPGMDLHQYKDMVLSRFGNPNIGDQLLRIASDGASKIPVFVQDTLRTALAQGRDTRRMAFLITCFTRYLGGKDDEGHAFQLLEPNLSTPEIEKALASDVDALNITPFKGWQLAENKEFFAQFTHFRSETAKRGTKAVLAELLGLEAHFKNDCLCH